VQANRIDHDGFLERRHETDDPLKARNERDVTAQAIELGHDDRGAELLGHTKRRGELWALVQGIRLPFRRPSNAARFSVTLTPPG
jgi:hypothetical protein